MFLKNTHFESLLVYRVTSSGGCDMYRSINTVPSKQQEVTKDMPKNVVELRYELVGV